MELEELSLFCQIDYPRFTPFIPDSVLAVAVDRLPAPWFEIGFAPTACHRILERAAQVGA